MGKTVFLVRNVAGDGFGGGEIYQLRLAKRLVESGFCPIIITNSRKLAQQAKENEIRVLKSPFLEQQNWSGWRNILLIRYLIFQKRLEKWYLGAIKKYQPVVVNIQSRDDMIAGTLACKKMGVRVLWTDHADFRNWVLWNVNVRFKNVIGKRIVELSREVSKVIFVSERVEEETKRMIKPLALCNTVVIKNGVEDKKAEFGDVKAEKNSFVFVGRVTEEKGIQELVEAFREVAEKCPGAKLNIYGEGEIDKYKKKCDGCGGVVFHGQAKEPLKVLAQNEIFVLPSYREGLSLSLLDAAMMGKKIIASDVDGNQEVIVDKKTGLLVPAKNARKLAEAMIWMLEHRKEAEDMAKSVRKRYEEEFDFKKIFEEKMLPLYNIEERSEK